MIYKKICIGVLFLFTTLNTKAQGPDEGIGLIVEGSYGLVPIKMSGQYNISDTDSKLIYVDKDTLSLSGNIMATFGASYAFYKNKDWCIGAKLEGGIGFIFPIKAAEGLGGLNLHFPQYIYYRNYSTRIDFTINLGYKYTRMALPYHSMVSKIEVNLGDQISIGLYGTLFSFKYYTLYTNGQLNTAAKINEFGITLTSTIFKGSF